MPRELRNRAPPPPPPPDEEELSDLSEPETVNEEEQGDEAEGGASNDRGKRGGRGNGDGDGDGDDDDDGMDAEVVQLQFDQELTWTAGRAPTTKVLLRRLEDLYAELQALDQEVLDMDSIGKIREGLSHRNMLTHKDPGVKAYAACCIVELLRVTAPDAPFEQAQLQVIFAMITKHIAPLLANTSDPYHAQHVAIFSSLADVKSIVLLTDVDGADDLVYDLFVKLFDAGGEMKAASDNATLKDVQSVMVDIMVTLVEESEGGIPAKVVDAIMAQFLRAVPPGGRSSAGRDSSQATLLPKTEPVPYTMAKVLCRECHEKMARYFGQYFNDFVLDASRFGSGPKTGGLDGDEDRGGRAPTDDELKELKRAHDLIRELWRAAPDVLVNVVPQVEVELSMDSPDMRRIATETIGDMISGIGSRGPPPTPTINPATYPPVMAMDETNGWNEADDALTKPVSPCSFLQKYPATYKAFLGRKHDKSASIRASWVLAVGYVLATSAGGIGLGRDDKMELIKELGEKLNDQDEKVRLAAIKAIEAMSIPDVVHDLGRLGGMDKSGSVLANFADRCRDRRPAVRVEATILMAKMWAAATGELAAENDEVEACLAGIPSRILNAFYANDRDINLLIDRVMYEYLLPLNFPLQKKGDKAAASQAAAAAAIDANRVRTERILLLIRHLDKSAKKAFFILVMRQPKFATAAEKFIQACEAFNGGATTKMAKDTVTKQMAKVVDWFAMLFPDEARAKSDLHRFVKLNDRRCYQLVKFAISTESDYTTVSRSFKEMVKRIGANTAASSALETIVPLFYRFAFLLLNKGHLGVLIECVKASRGWMSEVAREFLTEVSQSEPTLMDSYSVPLQKSIADNAPSGSKPNDAGVAATLKAFSAFARSRPGGVSTDGEFAQKLMAYALYGKPVGTAKHAITILMSGEGDQQTAYAVSLMHKIMNGFSIGSPHFLNKLAAIGQLELVAPTVTTEYEDQIREMAVQKLILQTRTEKTDADPDWVLDSDMDQELTAKCLALRLLVNRFRSAATEDGASQDAVKTRGQAVLKMLRAIIVQKGEVATAKNTPNHYRSRLLLEAALLSLKMCTIPMIDEMYAGTDFNHLALVAQDSVPQVRHSFVEKLQKYLAHRKLRARFHTIVFLTAFEPSVEFRSRIETWLRSMARGSDSEPKQPMTSIVARLISLLAHHPDYSTRTDDLVDFGRYLVYYVNLVATEANLGRIHAYTEKAKQANDGIDPAKTPRVRLLCDMAQSILSKWQYKKSWSFQACSEKVGLPIGLFTVLSSHDEAQTVAGTNHLPQLVEEKLDAYIRHLDKKGRELKRKSMVADGDEPPSKKAKPGSRGGATNRLVSRPKPKPRRIQKEDSGADWGERRRSGRSTKKPVYAETDSEEDDEGEGEDDEDDGGEAAGSEGDDGDAADVQMADSEMSSLSDLDDIDEETAREGQTGRNGGGKQADDEDAEDEEMDAAPVAASKSRASKKRPQTTSKAKATPARAIEQPTRSTRSRRSKAVEEDEE